MLRGYSDWLNPNPLARPDQDEPYTSARRQLQWYVLLQLCIQLSIDQELKELASSVRRLNILSSATSTRFPPGTSPAKEKHMDNGNHLPMEPNEVVPWVADVQRLSHKVVSTGLGDDGVVGVT